jgi:spore maturation protein CgeB
MDEFFEPGREILVATSADDVVNAIELGEQELRQIGKAAREKVFSAHTADHRVRDFLDLVGAAA